MSKIYGIDLGTTNSLLGYGDTLLTDLVPSVVDFNTGKAGRSEYENMKAVRSFKVDISMFKDGERSIAASARVLRQLVTESGEDVHGVVISVPAYFTDNQRQATREAATKAGLNVVDLINEPTAAAIYASRNAKDLSVIFDLGGGTFDVSIIDSRLGNYDVQATDGRILGGDDFDKALRNCVIKDAGIKVHHFYAEDLEKLKFRCCEAKIRLQKTRQPVDIDLTEYSAGTYTLTPETYISVMKFVFAPAVKMAKDLIADTIPAEEPYKIVMVGGSTRCPYLQEWVQQELNHDLLPVTYNPDKIVAQGAAFYAKMVEDGVAEVAVSDITKALSIADNDGVAHQIIPPNSKIPIAETLTLTNPKECRRLEVMLYQGANYLAEDNEYIGELIYDYGEVKHVGEGILLCTVTVNTDGTIKLSCKELLKPEVSVKISRASR